jgi:hypothetical protein
MLLPRRPRTNINAKAPLSDEESDAIEAEESLIMAADGHGQGHDEEVKDAGEPGEPEPGDGDHLSDAPRRGDQDDERDPSGDATTELAELWMQLSSAIMDKAVLAISLNIAAEPVIINHPAEKKYIISPKRASHGVVYDVSEYRTWIRVAMVAIGKLQMIVQCFAGE